jgi:adenylosuccinate synthase
MGDLLHTARLRTRLEAHLPDLRRRLGTDGVDVDMMELMRRGRAWGERLREHVVDTSAAIHARMVQGDSVVFEGAQGTMLDIDHGTYPFVTSSNTVAGNACVGAGVGPTDIDAVLGVVKAYTTRVGEGPFPTELQGEVADQLRKAGGEFGSTTGRPRRCGWFDAVIALRSAALNGLTGLVLTKLDVLSGLEKLRVGTSYRIFDQPVVDFPCCVDELARCEYDHIELPGWQEDITGVREFADLPETARAYVDRLEELVGVPIRMISVGPSREQIILRSDPFIGRGSA